MFHFKEYVKAKSLSEAWELNQKKANRVIGGMLWLKMQDKPVKTAIDLSGLGLDVIEETEGEYRIGAMVSLRELELHKGLNGLTDGAMRESLRHIVGVQFRNVATVGGSLFGRFGFSDVLTMFLAMDASVELYKGGLMSMEEFAEREPDRDILVRVIVKKRPAQTLYLSHRNTKTDFPVLTCAVWRPREALPAENARAIFGAAPRRARAWELSEKWMASYLSAEEEERRAMAADFVKQVPTGTNSRASARYRTHLAGVLLYRALEQLEKNEKTGGGAA